ncbi:MAG: hypothetical protein LC792_09795, partial [Actinobacteria bacterium]|nr:hypothetical protein [Actinomycetota bacterium]
MTKRLGMFLGLGLIGVVLLLTGLAWDAVVHAHDPLLAGREGIFTLGNPGHALMGLGIGLVLVSLIGAGDTLLSEGASGRWARPGVRQAFLTLSTVVVVAAAGITSWAGQAGHDHPSAAHATGHDAAGQLAASVDGSHGHATDTGDGVDGSHEHPAAEDGPTAGAAGHDHATSDGATDDGAAALGDGLPGHDHPSTSVVHDHVSGTASSSAAGSRSHAHDGSEVAGPAAPAGHDHTGTAAGGSGPEAGGGAAAGDHHHESPPNSPPAPDDAPAGTWTELRYGPFVITPAGAGGDADHANIAVPTLAKPCSNCFLQEFQPDLVYADGSPANLDTGMMLHHAVLFSAGRADPTCGPNEPFPGKLGQRFFASGNERTPG